MCSCDKKTISSVARTHLTKGHSTNCGCMRSHIQRQLSKNKALAGNSFADWLIEHFGDDAIEQYCDQEKNQAEGINIWETNKTSDKKIWIKCQKKDYHGSYQVRCSNFTRLGNRCPYCCNHHGKVHKKDSLGELHTQSELFWSDKNSQTPLEFAPRSQRRVLWKCNNSQHADYERTICHAVTLEFRCPKCMYSKGESRVLEVLEKFNLKSETQKKFADLLGCGGAHLMYDFYLPDFNLLIEYDGEFHFHKYYEEQNYEIQQVHDRLKNEYAQRKGIELLRIPYWDFENIEKILAEKILGVEYGEK